MKGPNLYTVRGQAVILFEQDGVRMAVRAQDVAIHLTANFTEPEIPLADYWIAPQSTLDHYDVSLTGKSQGLTIWDGRFEQAELTDTKAVEA